MDLDTQSEGGVMKRGDLALVRERIYVHTENHQNKQTVWKKIQVGTFLILRVFIGDFKRLKKCWW